MRESEGEHERPGKVRKVLAAMSRKEVDIRDSIKRDSDSGGIRECRKLFLVQRHMPKHMYVLW